MSGLSPWFVHYPLAIVICVLIPLKKYIEKKYYVFEEIHYVKTAVYKGKGKLIPIVYKYIQDIGLVLCVIPMIYCISMGPVWLKW